MSDPLHKRVLAHRHEAEELEDILVTVLNKIMAAYGMRHTDSWYLSEYTASSEDDVIRLHAVVADSYDMEIKHFSIPAHVIDNDEVDKYCEQLKLSLEEERTAESEARKQREIARLEGKLRVLRGQIKGD